MRSEFGGWLEQQYDHDIAEALVVRANRVERHYGDLDRAYDGDRLEGVLATLRYTPQDERRRKPNPSRIPFEGNIRSNINAFRAATEQYRRFRAEASGAPRMDRGDAAAALAPAAGQDDDGGQKINLERDLQAALRHDLGQLEPGLAVVDEGEGRQLESGVIDITARDAAGRTVVILARAGIANLRVVSQIPHLHGRGAGGGGGAARARPARRLELRSQGARDGAHGAGTVAASLPAQLPLLGRGRPNGRVSAAGRRFHVTG